MSQLKNISDERGCIMNGSVLPVRCGGEFCYNIHIEDTWDMLPEALRALDLGSRRVCIVTDSNVGPLYSDAVKLALEPLCREISVFTIPAGEEHKNLDEVRKLYLHLIGQRFDRNDILFSLGGGVVGDMTGFAAATYLRGIRFVQLPTTLLSQVDSSIGGKTGVDLEQYKNMVGAFHMPSLVYINLAVLGTLSSEQFASGMGEVLKHGLIRDGEYYEYLITNMEEIGERDLSVLAQVVEGSCRIKRSVVEADPTEKGERALLNYGHTLGHAIEKLKNFTLPHGHCVALGCIAAGYISWKRGLLDEGEFYELRDMMVGFDLPIGFDELIPEDIIEASRHDKKMDAGKIRFILLTKIGRAKIVTDVTEDEMLNALRFISY